MRSTTVFFAAALSIAGAAQAQVQMPAPTLNRNMATVPAIDSNAVTAGLLRDVAALRSEIAALKAENQLQAKQIADADKKANDARVAGVGLDKFVTNFKSAYDNHGHLLQHQVQARLAQLYVVVDGQNHEVRSPYGNQVYVVTSGRGPVGGIGSDSPLVTGPPQSPSQ